MNHPPAPARAAMRRAADRHPRALVVQNIAARTCLARGGARGAGEALAIATRAMQDFPAAPEPAEIAAAASNALGHWDEAVAMARQWKQRAPSAGGANLATAAAYLGLKRPRQAIAVLEPFVARRAGGGRGAAPELPREVDSETPLATRATVLYAEALVDSGRAGEAEALLASRIRRSPQYRSAWVRLASRQLTDYAAAGRWLDAAGPLAEVPESIDRASPPAQQASFSGPPGETAGAGPGPGAIPGDGGAFKTFADRAGLAEAWLVLARRSGRAEHVGRAREMLARLAGGTLDAAASTADEVLALGLLCEAGGDAATAETAYRRTLAKDPANVVAMNNLAMILVGRGEPAAAETLALRAAAAEHPRRASFFDTLATAQAALKKWPQALQSVAGARELEPGNVSFQIHQAALLDDAGERAMARKAFENVSNLRYEDASLGKIDRERLTQLRRQFAAG
jgi:tetratricopeptide (TPR) repeat protein